jgi:hypothetical protein
VTAQEIEEKRLRGALAAIRSTVDKQAEDEGLWFVAQTASEAYLQQELRKLHQIVEKETLVRTKNS